MFHSIMLWFVLMLCHIIIHSVPFCKGSCTKPFSLNIEGAYEHHSDGHKFPMQPHGMHLLSICNIEHHHSMSAPCMFTFHTFSPCIFPPEMEPNRLYTHPIPLLVYFGAKIQESG